MGDVYYNKKSHFYYNLFYVKHRRDIPFYVEMCSDSKDVLDVGCGPGTLAIPLSKKAKSVLAFDISSSMVTLGNEAAKAAGLSNLEFRVADMTNFDFQRKFDLITVGANAFQELDSTEKQLACLSTLRNHLAESGKLLLSIHQINPRYLQPGGFDATVPSDTDASESYRVTYDCQADLEEGYYRGDVVFQTIKDDIMTDECRIPLSLSLINKREIALLFRYCNLKIMREIRYHPTFPATIFECEIV